VRIIFDQGTPVPLRDSLARHEVVTAYERGWSSFANGELLDAAEREGFAVLITTDSPVPAEPDVPPNFRRCIEDHQLAQNPRALPMVVAGVDEATTGSYIELQIP
jgi:hypothetical protein